MTIRPLRCDLCSRTDGVILIAEHTTAPGVDQRRPGPRRHHQSCVDALRAHEAGERARTALELDAAIRRHERRQISDRPAAPAVSDAEPSSSAATTIGSTAVVANLAQASAGLGGERVPAPASSGQHGSAAVLANFSTAPPTVDVERFERIAPDDSAAAPTHAWTGRAGRPDGTATVGAGCGTPL